MIILTDIVIALATITYTWINYKLLKESQETRKQKITPLLVAFLKSTEDHSVLELHIKNIGEGLAKNVKIKTIKDYNLFGTQNQLLSEIGIFKNGMTVFPPQYEIQYQINSITRIFEQNRDEYIDIEVSYNSINGSSHKERYTLPFNQMYGRIYSNPPETFIGQIPHYLKEINTTLKNKEKTNK
jgi:hypothetical protein